MTTQSTDPIVAGARALAEALDTDEPISLTDGELLSLAENAAEELRRRLPRYALEQGDLDEDSLPEIEARESLLETIQSFAPRADVAA